MYNIASSPTLTNTTFSDNSAVSSGGGIYNYGSSPVIRNSILYGNTGGEIISSVGGSPAVSYSDVQGGYPGTGNIDAYPLLSPLANNGGFTKTMALRTGSPAIDAGDDANCPTPDQRGVTRPQGSHCDMGAYEAGGIKVIIESGEVGSYALEPTESTRQSYANVSGGPVKIIHAYGVPLISAERVIFKVKGVNTSFTEMMGLPDSQLDKTYWLPWYNNVDLDSQLRFANVDVADGTVHIFIGGQEMGTGFPLLAGESTRVSFPDISDGPVKIESDVNIVAAERVIYKVNGVNTSFSEMMALPNSQMDKTYWLPWYNNRELDSQLRFANVGTMDGTVHIFIGGQEMGTGFPLLAGESTRVSFPSISDGPVKIESDVNIVAAERVIYKVNNLNTSFSEMMALPNSQVDKTYWLPWYNNRELDSQLRFANVGLIDTTVHILIGGQEIGTGISLLAGESTRVSFPSISDGPVQIVSDVPIVASERVIYKVNTVNTSFSEMMGLPDKLLDPIYLFPWYNNVDLDTQLRFGAP
jgi:predicted outer membrane repeat protein